MQTVSPMRAAKAKDDDSFAESGEFEGRTVGRYVCIRCEEMHKDSSLLSLSVFFLL